MDFHTKTITELHEGLVKKDFTCRQLVQACLDRITAYDEALHAFLSVASESALVQADVVDEKIAKGHPIKPLEGIPYALKDNLLVKGGITTGGSKILENYVAPYSATVVEKLAEAGAIVIGKTNLDEFAMGSSTENSAYGPSHNPWDISRVPGGSSGGSAVAVASGECAFALGTDTGGSVRQPAALCGIVGLKPTYGTVSRHGAMAMAASLNQVGAFGRSVADVTTIFDTIKGPDRFDGSLAQSSTVPVAPALHNSIKGMKIGVPKEYFIDGMDSDIERTVRTAIDELKNLGAEIVPVSLPHTSYALAVYYVIMPAEISADLARLDGIRYGTRVKEAGLSLRDTYMRSRAQGFGKEPRRRIILGTYVLAAGYYDAYYKKAQKVRALVRKDFEDAFKDVDCIVTPTSPVAAFKIGEKSAHPLTMYLADIFTVSCNIAGIPGLSVPCGFVEREGKKLPVGLQILGKHFDEATILRVGHNYEKATEWHQDLPQL